MLNIPSSVVDPSYRYKMPRLISKKESRGTGSKTCIMNMGDVAGALKRNPIYCVKFFGYELGASTSYTNKKGEGERTIINGHHDTEVFQGLLDKFIEKYVLCQNCSLPEMDMRVKKDSIVGSCKACGCKTGLDMGHKVATLIVKNPPEAGVGFGTRAECKLGVEGSDHSDEGDEMPKKAEKMKKDKSEKTDKKTNNDMRSKKKMGQKERVHDEEAQQKEQVEAEDTNVSKGKKDKKDRKGSKDTGHAKSRPAGSADKEGNDIENEHEHNLEMKYGDRACKSLVSDMVAWSEKQGTFTPDTLFDELRAMQVTLVFDNSMRMYVALSVLFKDGIMDAERVVANEAYIRHFIAHGKCSFPVWIWGFDAFLDSHPQAAKGYPHVLKALYDKDLAEESRILAHYRSERRAPGFEAAARAAAPFLRWLETADSDEDSDDDNGSGTESS